MTTSSSVRLKVYPPKARRIREVTEKVLKTLL